MFSEVGGILATDAGALLADVVYIPGVSKPTTYGLGLVGFFHGTDPLPLLAAADGTLLTDAAVAGAVAVGGAIPPTTIMVAGSDGTDARPLLTDPTGKLQVVATSAGGSSDVVITGPLDVGGNVKVAIENTPAVTISGTPSVDVVTIPPVTVQDAHGNELVFLTTGALASTETPVAIDGSLGTLPPFASTPTVNLGQVVAARGAALPSSGVLVGGSDGTDLRAIATDTGGQVKVLVENTPAVTISGTPAVTISGTLPAFAATPTVNLGQVVAAPGAALPADAVLIGGSDGTDLRPLTLGPDNADGEAVNTGNTDTLVKSRAEWFNGTSWDRVRGNVGRVITGTTTGGVNVNTRTYNARCGVVYINIQSQTLTRLVQVQIFAISQGSSIGAVLVGGISLTTPGGYAFAFGPGVGPVSSGLSGPAAGYADIPMPYSISVVTTIGGSSGVIIYNVDLDLSV